MWRFRVYKKRLKQWGAYMFATRPYYEVTLYGPNIKLGYINPYHHSLAEAHQTRHHAMGVIKEFLKIDVKLMYDIGGHNGIVGLLYAKAHPNSKVTIFEPSKENYRQIVENIKLNELSNCEAMHAAVGEKDGSMTFSQKSTGGEGKNADGEVVPVYALSSLPHADLIKTDAVGAEASILRGLNYKPIIQLGVDFTQLYRYGDTEETLWEEVKKHGYEIRFMHKSPVMSFYLLT